MKIAIILILFLLVKFAYAESVSLRWDAPVTNTDATPLTDLAGFKVYYGTATGVYDTNIDVGNRLCYVLGGLTAGVTYYFAATAYDVEANESGYSNEVSKLIASGDEGHCDSNAMHMKFRSRTKATGGFGGGFQ